MKFRNTFSTRQVGSIFFLLVGIMLIAVDPVEMVSMLKGIGIIMIIISAYNFCIESHRKYKILKPHKKNHYDSKAEERIAKYFKRKNIIFHHHPHMKLEKVYGFISNPFKKIMVEPDFYLPEFEVFVEYWGLIDDKEYKEKVFNKKTKLYKDNDVEYLSLYPKNLDNLDFVFTSKLLDLLKKRQGIRREWR